MYAAVVTQFGGPEVLEYLEVDRPSPGPNQVLIKVAATSVNYADIKGRYGNKGAVQPPYIPGLDVAGTIVAVGSEVSEFQVGQRIIAFPAGGSYAEYVVADAILTYVLPDSIDFKIAAACPIVSFTSYKLLADVARIVAGETVLIHAAAGGIGTTAIQLAKLLGASQVIGVVSSESKIDTPLRVGADVVIDSSKEDFAQRTLELTNGRGVDVILDSVAGRVTEQSLQCLAWYGRLVQFGNSSGEVGTVQSKDLHTSCRSVLGFSLGTTRAQRPHLLRDVADKVLEFIADGSLQMMIGDTFPLRDAKLAHELVENRRSQGKVLLIP
ncbi:NADPH:quinone oxidoreductase family protein [Paenibacillus albiflavus]|uniref:NADPH:quinone oxidoreductase family protein n=1 Tax=Paenibacillus albiflavus TaxID=2545760 RepID=A0A4R4EPB1_9BACL|nr:NADPH:quinone oxidoreductase family protein [Paenibacillus albiflavus]TCZ80218.1 NADPH:quinone oxidoreductase family protein [Paenibacillus albiflavus]